jgi:hypothetical protein
MRKQKYSFTILDFGTRYRLVVSFMLRSLYHRGKSPFYIGQEGAWATELVWKLVGIKFLLYITVSSDLSWFLVKGKQW